MNASTAVESRTVTIRAVWGIVRLAAAGLLVAAIATQLTDSIRGAAAATTPHAAHLPTVLTNFFSYFTILSNAAAAVVLVIAGAWLVRHARDGSAEPRVLGVVLACVSTYMIITGIVFNLLLRDAAVGITTPWVNEVMHVVGPIVLLADVLFTPGRRRLAWSALVAIAAFPVAWAAYTLLRANLVVSPRTGEPWWYPYPFLDPHLVPGGYLGVSGYIVGIAAAIILVGAGVVWFSRRRGSEADGPPAGGRHAARL